MNSTTAIYDQEEDDPAEIAFLINLFHQRRLRRLNFETQWEEAALLAWPEYSSSFFFGRDLAPGVKRSQHQVDSSVQISSHRFGAIADFMVTPSNMVYTRIKDEDEYLMKDRSVALWYDAVTQCLWNERYKATANFIAQNQMNMQGLGVFGNMGMYIDELDDYLDPRDRGLRYLGLPVGEIYLITDHQGRVVGFIRHFRLNAQQAKTKWPVRSVPVIEAALQISSAQLFDFLQIVRPNTDYHPEWMLHPKKRWRYESVYISYQGQCILERGGFRSLPLAYGRYMLAPDEDHGRGPMQMALNSSKTLNAEKRVHLKAGHRGADPVLFVGDPSLIDLKANPGDWNAGGFINDKFAVATLPAGNIQITEKMMEMEKEVVDDAFLVSLFKLILANPEGMPSARQVVEYVNERAVLLHPTLGGQNTQYVGYIVNRELDLLSWQRKLPPMPPALKEARAHAKVVYANPIGLSMRAPEIAGFVRTMEFVGQAIQSGADPEIADNLEIDEFLQDQPEYNNFPTRWIAGPKKLAQKRQGRAQAAERDRQVKELPGKAAIIKAQAIQSKAATGGNIGGTLSGVPAGQMPQMPGQQ